MKKRMLAWTLTAALLISSFPLSPAAASKAEKDSGPGEIQPILSYSFQEIDENGKIHDDAGNYDATVLKGAGSEKAPEIVSGGGLELNNTVTQNGKPSVLKSTDANGISIPVEAFQGLTDYSIQMKVKLHSTACWNGLVSAGVGSKDGYLILANQGSPDGVDCGITCASSKTTNDANEMRIKAPNKVYLPIGKDATMTFTQRKDHVARLYIDGKKVAEGVLKVGLPDLCELADAVVQIGQNSIWPDPGLDGVLEEVKVYDTVLYDETPTPTVEAPVAYYTFDQEGNETADLSGNGNNAKIVGGDGTPEYIPVDGRGQVLDLENEGRTGGSAGTGEGLSIPIKTLAGRTAVSVVIDAKLNSLNNDDVSMPTWLDVSANPVQGNTDNGSKDRVLSNVAGWGYGMTASSKAQDLGVSTEDRIRSSADDEDYPELNKWVKIAFVQDSKGNTQLYLDGRIVAGGLLGVRVGDVLKLDNSSFTIGRPNCFPDSALDAQIDNVRVYDYALTAEQTADPPAPLDIEPDAYYTFDHVQGTTVPDESGNGQDASLVNGATVRNNAAARGSVAYFDNSGLTGKDAQGIELPAELFKGVGDFTLVMDTYLSSTSSWMGLLAAGSDKKNYMILANQGNKGSGDFGLTCATVYQQDTSKEERIKSGFDDRLPVGKWARMVFTQTADGASSLYIDGTEVASGHLGTAIGMLAAEAGFAARIGSNTIWPDPGLDGLVDNVRIYKEALTADEINRIPWDVDNTEPKDPEFPELGGHGVRGDYYLFNVDDANTSYTFGDYEGTYIDPNVDFSNSDSFGNVLSSRTGASDAVGVRWTGRIAAPEDGEYTFYLYSDNGAKVWIDDQVVIDYWVNRWDEEKVSVPVALKKGEPHKIKVEYFEASGGQHITLSWKDDQTVEKKAIPATAFYLPENFDGALISDIDTSSAQLDRAQGLDGSITAKGTSLDLVSKLELITAGGDSLDPAVFPKMDSKTASEIVFELPTTLPAGTYKIKTTTGKGITTISDKYFVILAAPGESDRPEHPRPDWERGKWLSLNGWWGFAYDKDAVGTDEEWYTEGNKQYDLQINVPFPWESPKSGIGDDSYLGQAWYHRTMDLDDTWLGDNKTIFMKFGAVDWNCTLYVNGRKVGDHTGGYDAFEFDITDYVHTGTNDIALRVLDNATSGGSVPALIGKQGHDAPCGYTQTSGIWQSVYIEGRTKTYLDYAHANPNVTDSTVTYDLGVVSGTAQNVTVSYDFTGKKWDDEKGEDIENGSGFQGSQTISLSEGTNEVKLEPISIDAPKLWNFDDPNLYYGTMTVTDSAGNMLDQVSTYFGLRQVTTQNYDGRDYQYVDVNGKPVFLSGLLDQGFWPQGIYTAPSEAAMKDDIEALKKRGFNMIRKHIKIEDPLEYYWCDKLGCFVWQDIPWGTQLNAANAGGDAAGRQVYEQCMETAVKRDYNHPSIIAIILFNETWGINHSAPAAADGMTTNQWIQHLYEKVKNLNPNLMVEDMSACNNDHIQPTDQNTWHFYTNWQNGYNDIQSRDKNTYAGSTNNFLSGFKQNGAPWLNSEYGGVGCGSGDLDVSWCFKFLTDALRMHDKLNGYVYTEPYDIEYERNGFRTYDRRDKIFGYDEIAYGGDMGMADLNQPDYVGVDVNPILKLAPGATYSAKIAAVNWSGRNSSNVVAKWRFDATDVYGNNISTGLSGSNGISYKAYTREDIDVSFKLPDQKCVGTLTVWLEDNGVKIAKNFANVVVTDDHDSSTFEYLGENSVVMRGAAAGATSVKGTGTVTYDYPVSKLFDTDSLDSMRIIAELSSVKGSTVNHDVANSDKSQTVEGGERPSNVTILVNGVEIETVYIPDDPRDSRGTLGLLSAYNGGTSAKDFGYLVNINVPSEKIEDVRKAIAVNNGEIVVSYAVKPDAENQNGVQVYSDTSGRYAVNPTVILNPTDVTSVSAIEPKGRNYKAEATLAAGQSISVRGGNDVVNYENSKLALSNASGELAETGLASGAHHVAVKLFDDHIQVYTDDNPVPVIDRYDYSPFTALTAEATDGVKLTISDETYQEDDADQDITKDKLSKMVDGAKKLSEKDYTPATWEKLQTALAAAESAAGNDSATTEDIQIAYHNLQNAIGALKPQANYDALNAAYAAAGKVVATTPDSAEKAALQAQITAAKAMLDVRSATQAEVDALTAALQKATAKAALRKAVESAKAMLASLKSQNYTKDSWSRLVLAETAAETTLAKADAGTTELQNAADTLANACSSLTGIQSEDEGGSSTRQSSVQQNSPTYRSDTTLDFGVNGRYLFRITSLDGRQPAFVVGTPGVFSVKLVGVDGNDYYYEITAIGRAGDKAGIYINGGAKLLTATIEPFLSGVWCDTTGPFTVKEGKTYQFRLKADGIPVFVCGHGSAFRVRYVGSQGGDYFFQATAIGKAGESAGFYINHEKNPRAVATIG